MQEVSLHLSLHSAYLWLHGLAYWQLCAICRFVFLGRYFSNRLMSSAAAHRSVAKSKRLTTSAIVLMASSPSRHFLYPSLKLTRDQSVLACGCAAHRRFDGLEATAEPDRPPSDNPVARRDAAEPSVQPGQWNFRVAQLHKR